MPDQLLAQKNASAEQWNSIKWSAGAQSNTLYAFFPATTYGQQSGLLASMDNGKTWESLPMFGLNGQVEQVIAHPNRADVLAVITSYGLYLSVDRGKYFSWVSEWDTKTTPFDFANLNLLMDGNRRLSLHVIMSHP